MSSNGNGHLNAISVDVEDWIQSVFDVTLPLTDRFHHSTRRVLEAFASRNVRGTFFILGLAAEKAPELVREIQQAGHEIQSHGYGHQLVHTLTRDQFREDLTRSKKLLEDMTGSAIEGYRAPGFTIGLQNLWANTAATIGSWPCCLMARAGTTTTMKNHAALTTDTSGGNSI